MMTTVLFGVLTGIASFIMGSAQKAMLIFEEPALMQAYQILFSVTSFTLPFIICYKIGGYRIGELVSFKKTEKELALPLIFLGVAFCSFANLGAAQIDNIFSSLGIDYSVGSFEFPSGFFGFVLSVLATAVVPAFVEEFAVRGIALGTLRKFGDTFALVTTSICFGIMHGNFEQMPFAIFVGLFLGFSVLKTGSLRVAITVHFINNFQSVILAYIPTTVSQEIQNTAFILYMFLTFVVGSFFLRKTEHKDFYTLMPANTLCSEKEKYKRFFTSAGVVIFIVMNLLEAVSFIFI